MLTPPRNQPVGRLRTLWAALSGERRRESEFEALAPTLQPSHRFREEIKREMMRADRSHAPLSLLLFDLVAVGPDPEERRPHLIHLADAVTECARLTDGPGWFRDAAGLRVGLILHQTEADKAYRVIRSVRTAFRRRAARDRRSNESLPDVACEVFAYPGGRGDGNGPNQLWLFDEDEMSGRKGERRTGGGNGNGNGAGTNGNGVNGNRASVAGRSVSPAAFQPLPPIVAEPIPPFKRALDRLGSGLGLILLSPIFLAIAAAIKLTSEGSVFFVQDRVGHHGRLFRLIKFRSMKPKHDPGGHQKYVSSLIRSGRAKGRVMAKLDPKNMEITFVGRILRKTYLDELPQLINVFRGEMSLVGPRPCLPGEARAFDRWHTQRFSAAPGMTGLWQVNGKNKTTFDRMVSYDIEYGRRCSLMLDLEILARTPVMILGELWESAARKRMEAKSAG